MGYKGWVNYFDNLLIYIRAILISIVAKNIEN
jgi:hypothetical protein